ncbi:CLUMA_CG014781, isoform A [Clunio marinus]|uniref:CLUMA_CG014781, isoform A n=1 Tax=Clunio marinus TaxID=568069 RepID=A0A1J1IQ33_9DIPT|nr:CLUMA_CG014781, isoform A [Clunio marinus]
MVCCFLCGLMENSIERLHGFPRKSAKHRNSQAPRLLPYYISKMKHFLLFIKLQVHPHITNIELRLNVMHDKCDASDT